jgi:glycosyltransferase involved in cell wall biosynthesis
VTGAGPDPSGAARPSRPLRILLVSQMWPSAADPDYGVFVAQIVRALEARGHTVDRAVVDHRGGSPARHPKLVADAVRLALTRRPDVVYAHFLVPAGAAAALASVAARVPLVVMAHGQDVANAERVPAVRAATRAVLARADTVICNSAHLRDRLPPARTRAEVIDCGVDLDVFAPRDAATARADLGLADLAGLAGPVFLFAGSLIERKNVVRLRDAFAAFGRGTLLVLGDGPLRPELEGRPGVRLLGRVAHDAVPRYMAAADVLCLPSLNEPLGQVLLEAMASERSVVATRDGGPPEFVTPDAGALVDPLDAGSIRAGLEHAAALPSPNPAARAAAAPHDVRVQAQRVEGVLLRATSRAASIAGSSSSGSKSPS